MHALLSVSSFIPQPLHLFYYPLPSSLLVSANGFSLSCCFYSLLSLFILICVSETPAFCSLHRYPASGFCPAHCKTIIQRQTRSRPNTRLAAASRDYTLCAAEQCLVTVYCMPHLFRILNLFLYFASTQQKCVTILIHAAVLGSLLFQ